MSKRTIICGDLHGCVRELEDLLEKCEATSDDLIVSVGDLVDRGEFNRETVEFFMKPGRVSIQGNHEERILKYYREWLRRGKCDKNKLKFRSAEHKRTFSELDEEHFEFLETLPLYLELPEHNVTVVHAGIVPDVPLHHQDPFILQHVGNIYPPTQGDYNESSHLQHGYWRPRVESFWTSKAPPGTDFWANLYKESTLGTIVFGHTGFKDVARFPHAVGLDTGCVFGRSLTALVLPDWKYVSVPARKLYKETAHIKEFEVAPGIILYS